MHQTHSHVKQHDILLKFNNLFHLFCVQLGFLTSPKKLNKSNIFMHIMQNRLKSSEEKAIFCRLTYGQVIFFSSRSVLTSVLKMRLLHRVSFTFSVSLINIGEREGIMAQGNSNLTDAVHGSTGHGPNVNVDIAEMIDADAFEPNCRERRS